MANKTHNEIVDFQKELDEQFLKIYEQRKKGIRTTDELNHGLVERINDFKFFLPLASLRSIGSDNKYESLPLMAKWVVGYNQMLGDLYTIVDMKNIVNYFINGKFNTEQKIIENEEYILYLRDKSVTNLALVSKTLQMHNTQSFKTHISFSSDEALTRIIKEKNYDWNMFKRENMSSDEWNLLEAFKFIENNPLNEEMRQELFAQKHNEKNKYIKLAIAILEKIYMDELGKPIFAISVPKLVRYLLQLNAY